ncbi:unnamed protein product [Schistocephalus solidus]|uniref:Secreted protein n=1 Tax=Schistocephalus solidus TaxID=70667 RepID=A0A183SER1_SCHSO|nr:unnamed protein product [Schistocephalus solidus]
MDRRTDTNKAAFFVFFCLAQQLLREMQDACMVRKAEKIQGYADRNEMKNSFKAIKPTSAKETHQFRFWISFLPYQRPSGPGKNFPVGKHWDPIQAQRQFISSVAPG